MPHLHPGRRHLRPSLEICQLVRLSAGFEAQGSPTHAQEKRVTLCTDFTKCEPQNVTRLLMGCDASHLSIFWGTCGLPSDRIGRRSNQVSETRFEGFLAPPTAAQVIHKQQLLGPTSSPVAGGHCTCRKSILT